MDDFYHLPPVLYPSLITGHSSRFRVCRYENPRHLLAALLLLAQKATVRGRFLQGKSQSDDRVVRLDDVGTDGHRRVPDNEQSDLYKPDFRKPAVWEEKMKGSR